MPAPVKNWRNSFKSVSGRLDWLPGRAAAKVARNTRSAISAFMRMPKRTSTRLRDHSTKATMINKNSATSDTASNVSVLLLLNTRSYTWSM